MDGQSLDQLLNDGRNRQFWLKPVGPPKDHPDWNVPEHRTWTESEIEECFAKNPAKVAIGAIVIAYRIRISKLIYVAERLPLVEWSTQPENRSDYWRRRYPFWFKERNLTPEYGKVWDRFDLQPFPLAKEYNRLCPDDPAQINGIL